MKYQLEYLDDAPDVLRVSVNQRLIKGGDISTTELTEEELSEAACDPERLGAFCGVVSELDGLEQEIGFGRYGFVLEKGTLFPWESILPHVLNAMQCFLAKDGKLERVEAANQTTRETANVPPQKEEREV